VTDDLDSAHLAVIVHEVRSPVAALAAVAEAVSEPKRDAAMRRELVRLALAACLSIERIVVDAAVSSVRLEPMDVASLARDAAASSAVAGAAVAVDVPAHPVLVHGDPVRLRQALDNLIANAIRHGASATPVVVRVSHADDSVEIAVTDQGTGIAADQLTRIFEPGVRLDPTRPGSGIGLTLSQAIVAAHGGALEVRSTVGAGSTFTIVLPLLPAQPAT
jgi:two-component system sensor histidine kinase BaeS